MKINDEKGYTLMELLVVIFLLISLSTVILLSNNGSKDVAKVNAAARKLEAVLTEAQSYGNSGKACPPGSNNFDNGYGVFVSTTIPDRIIVYCGNGNGTAMGERYSPGVSTVVETVYFDAGVKVTNAGTGNQTHVYFKRGMNGAHLYDNGTTQQASRTVTLGKGVISAKVTVNKTGLIYIEQ
jgi:type II secretory pathway pseudopilin PulG